MKDYLFAFAGVLITYLILDGIWLGVVAKDTYLTAMAGMLKDDYPVAPWVTFYLMYSAVATHLVVIKNRAQPLWRCGIDGALLGLASYGAYNLTNYAIIEGWPLSIAIKDWVWGTFVSATISICGWLVLHYTHRNPE